MISHSHKEIVITQTVELNTYEIEDAIRMYVETFHENMNATDVDCIVDDGVLQKAIVVSKTTTPYVAS